ncbi:MAG: glycosyltransferase family 2 protein [Veillonellales bacterium]
MKYRGAKDITELIDNFQADRHRRPTVSVIMPVYNVEKYISKAIESVLGQTYRDFELIIVDDGSPDRSGEIAEEYAKKEDAIRVLHKENGGLSDARNAGIVAAKGKYTVFMDSDDYLEDNLLEQAVYAAEEQQADVVMFGYFIDRINAAEQLADRETIYYPYGIYEYADLKNIQINANLLQMVGYAWNKMYLSQLLKQNNFMFTKGLSVVEDIVFNSAVFSKLKKLIIIDSPLYHYIHRERKTLVNMFHKDVFILHKKGITSRKKLFEAWGINQNTINEFISFGHISGIRYCCANMFYYKNELKLKEKYNYIKLMLNDQFTRQMIQSVRSKNKTDLIMKYITKYRLNILLLMLYSYNARKKLKSWAK